MGLAASSFEPPASGSTPPGSGSITTRKDFERQWKTLGPRTKKQLAKQIANEVMRLMATKKNRDALKNFIAKNMMK